jgi:MOSC domain-containing protein YiiM
MKPRCAKFGPRSRTTRDVTARERPNKGSPETERSNDLSDGNILAIHVGRPHELQFNGRSVLSAIYKEPVIGPVMVRCLNLDGDQQADLKVHGGPDKAVYCYPSEHYAVWSRELDRTLDFGFFGENLTLSGLREEALHIGDVLAAGEAMLQVSQPRLPCFKLGIKFGDQRFVARFLRSRRCGFYCRVLQEGTIESGQSIEVVQRAASHLTIAQSIGAALKGA